MTTDHSGGSEAKKPVEPPPIPADWHVAVEGEQLGPFTIEELGGLVRSGRVRPESLVWREGMPEWKPVASVEELAVLPFAATGTDVLSGIARSLVDKGQSLAREAEKSETVQKSVEYSKTKVAEAKNTYAAMTQEQRKNLHVKMAIGACVLLAVGYWFLKGSPGSAGYDWEDRIRKIQAEVIAAAVRSGGVSDFRELSEEREEAAEMEFDRLATEALRSFPEPKLEVDRSATELISTAELAGPPEVSSTHLFFPLVVTPKEPMGKYFTGIKVHFVDGSGTVFGSNSLHMTAEAAAGFKTRAIASISGDDISALKARKLIIKKDR